MLAANGGVVLQIGDRIEVLRDDGLPVRVIFDKVPRQSARAADAVGDARQRRAPGARPATLTYLTPGLGWNADYVALFDESAGTIDVQGWVTLTNNTGTTFANAETLLVAGAVGAGGNDGAQPLSPRGRRARSRRPAPRPRTASSSATSTSIRSPSARRSPTRRPSRSASSTSTARRRRKGYEYQQRLARQRRRAAERRQRAALLHVARAAGSATRCPPARCASICAMRAASRSSSARTASTHTPMGSRWRSAPATRSTSRCSRRWSSAPSAVSDAAGARRCATRSPTPGAEPVTVDARADGARLVVATTRGSSSESQQSERRISADGVGWQVPVPANGETSSPRRSTRATDARGARRAAPVLSLLARVAAAPARGADGRDLGRARRGRGHVYRDPDRSAGGRARSALARRLRADHRDAARSTLPAGRGDDPLRGRGRAASCRSARSSPGCPAA